MGGNTTRWIAIGCVALAVPFAFVYYFTSLSSNTAEVRGAAGEKNRVVGDGDYRLAARDEFYKLCSTIQSQQDQIENLEAEMEYADEERKEMLQSGITAQRNTMAENAREYNAKAANEASRGQFREAELPYEIDPEEEVSCGSAS